jgi:hypothetical protein
VRISKWSCALQNEFTNEISIYCYPPPLFALKLFYEAAKGKDMWYDPVFRVETLDGRHVWCKVCEVDDLATTLLK